MKKNDAKQPIGPGKAGTLKRAVYKAGGGKKTLKTLRAAPKATRKAVAKTPGINVKGVAKNIRANAGWGAGSSSGRTSKR